jgi:hypothetical protein
MSVLMQYPVILAFPISFPYISAKYFYLKEINVGILKKRQYKMGLRK